MFRPEHPNPQFMREDWLNLNGEWEFEIDSGKNGVAKKFYQRDSLNSKIIVPFCPESELSGIGNKDFMPAVWYRRTFNLSDDKEGKRTLIHFDAVDYSATLYINGVSVGTHTGGYDAFEFDITDFIHIGENVITLYVEDEISNPEHPNGKQSALYESHGCYYTRTTGIWQTVWLEFVAEERIKSVKFVTDINAPSVFVEAQVCGQKELFAEVFYDGETVGKAKGYPSGGTVMLNIPLSSLHLWEIGNGRLYDIRLTYGEDEVESYFGMRSVGLLNGKFLLNGKPVFQRLVLDQGFYPDGIYTAPDESLFKRDIKLALDMGFNGARLHQKVFDSRCLYYCDKMGYIVWSEFPNWGIDYSNSNSIYGILNQWVRTVKVQINHPSIITWCPFNETWDYEHRRQDNRLIETVYRITKLIDPTRPCVDTSGNYHTVTDIFDVHDYNQNPEEFKADYDKLMTENTLTDRFSDRQHYSGEPVMISEYGGIQWDYDNIGVGWGYGVPENEEEFYERYEKLTKAILDNDKIFGFCYTQLYDVEQERNGLYTYDRRIKFSAERIRKINQSAAAVEIKNEKG